MSVKRKLQQKMRQTLYAPRNGKFSLLKTAKSLDTVEKSLSEGIEKIVGGKKKSKGDKENDEKKEES